VEKDSLPLFVYNKNTMKTFLSVVILAAIAIALGMVLTKKPNNNIEEAMIQVFSPTVDAVVGSPLTVTGKARGNWYFEASFPIRLFDANGKELAVAIAQAQGEWMTTDFVPFQTTLTFTNPTTSTGTLVLEKDNPSGLPQHAGELRVPVKFNPSAEATRNIKLYFYDENKDKDANGNVRCSAQGLVATDRSIAFTNTPIQDALKELFKEILPGVTLSGANLANGVLTLLISDPQNQTTGGSCKTTILRAQVEATAKQFGGVTEVRYLPPESFQP